MLFEQFKFFLNLYFLIMASSQFIPEIRIGYLYTYWGPLVSLYFFHHGLLLVYSRNQNWLPIHLLGTIGKFIFPHHGLLIVYSRNQNWLPLHILGTIGKFIFPHHGLLPVYSRNQNWLPIHLLGTIGKFIFLSSWSPPSLFQKSELVTSTHIGDHW